MADRLDRRSFLVRSAVTASGLVVAGAGAQLVGSAPAGAVRTNGPGLNGISAATPKRGGSVVIGTNAEEQGFNPTTGRFDNVGYMYGRTVFDPLMVVTADGGVAPYLAESLVPARDFTEWTITMRKGIKFHDGTLCDGAALTQNMAAQVASPVVGIALKPLIAGVEQSGPLSCTVRMKQPWVSFPATMAEQQVCFVAAPSMLDAPNGGTDHPVGTGPFVFGEWVPDDHFTATANPHYWRRGLPYLASITYKPFPDEQARAEALQSGSIQMMHTADPDNILTFRGDRQWAYVDNSGRMVGAPNVNCLMLNCAQPPFDDVAARRLVATAVSADSYSKVIDRGVNAPAAGIYQPGSPYYTPTPYPAYDPAAARRMAAEYARRHHAPLSFTLSVIASAQGIRLGQYFQGVLGRVGLKVTVDPAQASEVINQALVGTYQAAQWSQFGAVTPDLNYIWFSTETIHRTGLSINTARNYDPQIQAAMVEGMATTDTARRIAAFARVNQRLGVDVPYVWTDRITWALVSRPSVRNWNNPTAPSGTPALGNDQGMWFPTQMWVD